MVVVKFLVFVSEVVSIFSKILTWIIGGGKRIPLPHQLNYWGGACPGCPPKSTPMLGVSLRHGRRVGAEFGGTEIISRTNFSKNDLFRKKFHFQRQKFLETHRPYFICLYCLKSDIALRPFS